MSDSIWISPLIEHCLSSYQTEENLRPDCDLTWEDDGSNIRYPSSAPQNALINDWSEGDGLPSAKLTDSDTQIDAILSRGSLDEYNRTFPREPLSKDGCRGYLIHLSAFELVYEYSTAKPNVHLYVQQFSIIWDRGKTRSPPTGKIVRKKPALALLMKQIYARIRGRDQERRNLYKTNPGADRDIGNVPATQAPNWPEFASTQAQLMSQLPSRLSMTSIQNHDLAYDAPLSQIGPRPEPPEASQPSSDIPTDTNSSVRPPATIAVGHSGETSSVSFTSNALRGTTQARESRETTENRPPSAKQIVELRPARPQMGSINLSLKEVISPATAKIHPSEQTVERRNSPYSPEKQLNSQLQASQSVTLRPRNATKTADQAIADPWEGMTEIQSVDVTVLSDQAELLGHPGKGQWYPHLPGQPTLSGHVPPALLDEWNRLVLRRSQGAAESRLKSPETDEPIDHITPSAVSDSSERSAEDYEWDQSPERTPRRRMVLPLDSSPVRDRSLPRAPQNMKPGRQAGTLERKSSKFDGAPNGPQSEASRHLGLNACVQPSRIGSRGSTNDVVSLPVAHTNDGHDSGSSSDSEMDVMVPQPLGGSTQQVVSSQMEHEVSSSGSSSLESSRHIQVSETPSALLHKPCTMMFTRNDVEPRSITSDMLPRADKSSFQSRIFNTYASPDGDSKGNASQSTSSAPVNGVLNVTHVHVANTPMSGQALQTQNSALQSLSGSLLSSSAPKNPESNTGIAISTYQSQSSNAFSSYRELPSSSMLSVEEQQPSPGLRISMCTSPHLTPAAFPLKRFASEVEIDGGASPSKRTRLDQKPLSSDFEPGVVARLRYRNSRFQECIDSAQSIAAKNVYEKFCNDYPAYHGDYAHFTKLCSKLQAFRAQGSLQRSFLWDDFIIKHLEEYPAYLGECMSKETKALLYEEFFATSFSRPTYKKRSLDVEAIDDCAAQVITIDEARVTISSSDATADTKISFTSSVRDQLSNFHTYSFAATQPEPDSQDAQLATTQEDNDISSEYSIPDSEPLRTAAQEQIQETPQSGDTDGIMEDVEEINDTTHETASVELGDEESPRNRTTPSDDEVMDDPLGDDLARDAELALGIPANDRALKLSESAGGEENVEGEINDDDDDDDDDDDNPRHLIATESAPPSRTQIAEEEDDEDEDEAEVDETDEDGSNPETANAYKIVEVEGKEDDSEVASDKSANAEVEINDVEEVIEDQVDETEMDDSNQNWFLSLSNIHATENAWSDDANTPFKKWAQADQNVFSIRQHRGGAKVSTNAKGVIQPMHHRQA
ncbi:hypothetical protein BJX64DRAFT_228925 [Aspergillus heterothallicus]